MNPIARLIASVVLGMIVATLLAVGLLLGASHAHAAGMTSPHAFAASYVEHGHGGHGGHR